MQPFRYILLQFKARFLTTFTGQSLLQDLKSKIKSAENFLWHKSWTGGYVQTMVNEFHLLHSTTEMSVK